MLIDREEPVLPEGEPDPATPAWREELARRMLAAAIARHEEANALWSAVHESYPRLPEPAHPRTDAELAEHRAWLLLLGQADEAFDSAEENLASRIQALFDLIAPEGRRARDSEEDYFVPRAVRTGGSVYVLADDVMRYEPRTNIVAVYREPMMIDLDETHPGAIRVGVEDVG